eukprot:CAMPEP_0174953678 /NCGR_PEP_ID=MMETSP1355-20121228/95995_1 /TAXON_ID=464990 /ORGANISM="Hemiselmis tepida, Strain CCMP443" /LENGTH=102 /DNA_ID=CAMNT_0016201385 /DNA_START=1225 /DNA_END=1533 /DNA_ORIENTATION=-
MHLHPLTSPVADRDVVEGGQATGAFSAPGHQEPLGHAVHLFISVPKKPLLHVQLKDPSLLDVCRGQGLMAAPPGQKLFLGHTLHTRAWPLETGLTPNMPGLQ